MRTSAQMRLCVRASVRACVYMCIGTYVAFLRTSVLKLDTATCFVSLSLNDAALSQGPSDTHTHTERQTHTHRGNNWGLMLQQAQNVWHIVQSAPRAIWKHKLLDVCVCVSLWVCEAQHQPLEHQDEHKCPHILGPSCPYQKDHGDEDSDDGGDDDDDDGDDEGEDDDDDDDDDDGDDDGEDDSDDDDDDDDDDDVEDIKNVIDDAAGGRADDGDLFGDGADDGHGHWSPEDLVHDLPIVSLDLRSQVTNVAHEVLCRKWSSHGRCPPIRQHH